MPLPTRQLGTNGPQVTAIGIGLMGLSVFYGTKPSDEERLAFLDHVYASGNRFWDTADMYGDSEALLGRWFAAHPGRREEIFLATKFANATDGSGVIRTDPAYVHEANARSLRLLGVDAIDLYYVHRVDGTTPIEDTMAALVDLKTRGVIRHIGLSEVSADTIRRAHAVHPVAAVQVEYSPFSLDIESPQIAVLQTCRQLGIAVVAYAPLGRGMLTGQLRSVDQIQPGDFRSFAPRFSAANFPKNLRLVEDLTALAAKKGVTSGQLSLAWLLRQWDMVIPIPGTKKTAYYDENMGALDVTLTDEEDAAIRKAIEATEVVGQRYAESYVHNLFRDTPKKA
ncbi:putative aldo-keto reductase (AKR13) [Sporothrix schenckii 1099-18]|uniref:NADP-dependent oxidoreductase domain-containing protein n=2 Tax=Sporothrix schenckii TaxID=29908 RepID=U7PPN5_SPOS1|nr:putative aldo-keto reductase (AKR13) [Sporothrix schenckii 1099-18]ERS96714.1 hypothetical protein HMPREF1624_06923 [Sporothrix schenckii ATCC 58251]KJR81435.1 putative aldo-keto reductase (AKR13) [Sporothrix schenckii 1099-18]